MARKYFSKALSVGLSLALCAGLVAPAFAASFTDLNNAIKNEGDWKQDAFEIGKDDDGNRKITLIEGVTREENETGINVTGTVTIDLNGKTISGKTADKTVDGVTTEGTYLNGAVINVTGGGNLTIQDSTARYDDDGKYVSGKITGSYNPNKGDASGGGVRVVGGSSLTLKSGTITGNTAVNGGGVYVRDTNSTFTMEGGEISGNKAYHTSWECYGGGVNVTEGGKFTMFGGEISGNDAKTNGGGVTISGSNSWFEMWGGEISGNTVNNTANDTADSTTNVFLKDCKNKKTYPCINVVDGAYTAKHSFGEEGKVTKEAQVGVPGVMTYYCQVEGCKGTMTKEIPAQEPPAESGTPAETEVPETPAVVTVDPVIGIDEPVVAIDDPAVPLAAGPATCGEFIDYLWRHEGEPEVDSSSVDHEYAPAIAWAQSIDILPDGMDFDELITVSMVRDILTNFAAWADMVMPELTSLTGEEDEAVLNCDEVLAEFFGEELAG